MPRFGEDGIQQGVHVGACVQIIIRLYLVEQQHSQQGTAVDTA